MKTKGLAFEVAASPPSPDGAGGDRSGLQQEHPASGFNLRESSIRGRVLRHGAQCQQSCTVGGLLVVCSHDRDAQQL
jgi:hypothetical protein